MSIGQFVVAHYHQCVISQPIVLNRRKQFVRETYLSSENAAKLHLHTALLQAFGSCKGLSPCSPSRPTKLSLTRQSKQKVGCASVTGTKRRMRDSSSRLVGSVPSCILPPASLLVRLAVNYVHADFRVFGVSLYLDVLGARYANVPREPLSLPYCSWCALTSVGMRHG
jgi:hypothetical protein